MGKHLLKMETNRHSEDSHMQDKNLARRVREQGDQEAFEYLFRAYYRRLHGFAYSYLNDFEASEDVVQNVFLKIWAKREEWKPAGTVKHYLFHAVRNESLTHIRNNKTVNESKERLQFDAYLFSYDNVEDLFISQFEDESKKLERNIKKAIDSLPERCRLVFQLHRQGGLTYEEIAKHLDISVNTVTTLMGRSLKMLKNKLLKNEWITILVICLYSFF